MEQKLELPMRWVGPIRVLMLGGAEGLNDAPEHAPEHAPETCQLTSKSRVDPSAGRIASSKQRVESSPTSDEVKRSSARLFEGSVPLATYETPLWPSVARGGLMSRATGGIQTYLISETMSRSVLVRAPSYEAAVALQRLLNAPLSPELEWLKNLTETTSRYCKLVSLHCELMGRRLFVRLAFTTGDASGHNMATKAASSLAQALCKRYGLTHISDSGNFCLDKKVSSVNAILGRGSHVQAHMRLDVSSCQKILKCHPKDLYELCLDKNWYGSHLAGSLHSSNAHFANMLLAFYLATGQDAANIVEGSQGQAWVDREGESYTFSCRLPHIIVGSVGSGKDGQAALHLQQLSIHGRSELAQLAAAVVLCGELSLLAALCRPGALIAAHERLERHNVSSVRAIDPAAAECDL